MRAGDIKEIEIPVAGHVHKGLLGIPKAASGIVIFAHGSGSSRLSVRNNFVAEVIRQRGLATLLFDLLTEAEDNVYENRFDIPLLTFFSFFSGLSLRVSVIVPRNTRFLVSASQMSTTRVPFV